MPGANGAARIRQWRAFKNAGAAVLRDGVYLLPLRDGFDRFFEIQADAARKKGGVAWVLSLGSVEPAQEITFRNLFDRGAAYAELVKLASKLRTENPALTKAQLARGLARLQKQLSAIDAGNFFDSGKAERREAGQIIATLAAKLVRDEPSATQDAISARKRGDYQRRTWVTRAGLWVDRVASAWLIRRFIDPEARFLWLKTVRKRPSDSLGFDFDGAEFTHVGTKVSFEVLTASFGLDRDPALFRIGGLVHALDVGSTLPPAATSFETVMHSARARCGSDDDRLLAEVSPTLDCLYAAYSNEHESPQRKRKS